ncbi:MAG: hypothetical protein V1701_05080 [Planctomycetota bacterium]
MLGVKNNTSAGVGGRVKYNEPQIQLLVEEFKKGDKKAFAELWRAVMPIVRRLFRRGLDEDTAEQLTSQVCLRLFENAVYEYDRAKSSFITWVYNVALRLKINEIKRFKPVLFSELADREEPLTRGRRFKIEHLYADTKSPLQLLIEKEDDAARHKALELLPILMDRLSPDEQYVIQAGIYDGLSDKDISLILEGDQGYAKKYQKIRERTLRKLGRMFAEQGIRKI